MNVKDRFVEAEWLDIRALRQYVSISERTLREWIRRPVDPLPAVRIGSKILVSRRAFDEWLEAHRVRRIDADTILNEMVAVLRANAK